MTLVQLIQRVKVRYTPTGYIVTVRYNGRTLYSKSHNRGAYNRLFKGDTKKVIAGYTYKGAFVQFYNECKQANGL